VSLLNFSSLSKSYGHHDIFSNLSGAAPHGARVGIVGPNGIGKTTLLRIFAGLEDPSGGSIFRARGLKMGYLPQEAVSGMLGEERTLWDEMLTPFAELFEREAELRRLEVEIATPDESVQYTDKLNRYGDLLEQFEREGGYDYETRIKQVLQGLGFDAEDYSRSVSQLSGGQKTRALLARLLLESPDILILDEPTNHLDIHAVEWLETLLSDWNGAALIVSHDRYFLDEAANKIWDLNQSRIDEYNGNYSAFVLQRAERRERQLRDYETQREFMAKEEDFIRRNIAGQNTAQAKGRRRRLDRLKATEGAVVERPRDMDTFKLRLDTNLRSGDRVLETHEVVIGYHDDGKPLFAAPDLLLWRGEVAALIGPNGTGKSTFLKTLLGSLKPLKGKVKLGSSLKIGYFAQAHEGLNPELSVMDEIRSMRDMSQGAVRDYAAKFLFTGDDVFKKIKVLSGGERGRVALAKLALEGANFLLLDEPTNHLDIPSQEILEAVLSDFDGTILLVSHDRYLIDALATQIWSLEDGEMDVVKGSYREWKELRDSGRTRLAIATATPAPARQPAPEPKAKKQPAADKSAQRHKAQRARHVQELEASVASLEKRLAEISAEIEAAGADLAKVRMLGEEYAHVEADLNIKLVEWEKSQ
jgi:ATP-binding cassette, subfamily F, member 3